LIEDQQLIALGRYNTSDTASLLIEYGYIYESKLADETGREQFFSAFADKIYLGLEDFFKSSPSTGSS